MGIIGRNQSAGPSVEQWKAQQLLSMLQSFCYSGLGDIERSRSGADGAMQINRMKYLNMTQTHILTYNSKRGRLNVQSA